MRPAPGWLSSMSFAWEGGTANLAAGTVLDVPPGSALETAIGAGSLTELTARP
jgi:hypothetical protein